MNIQLFLENEEVELNSNISFPLNKTFENLWNPTDIIVPYSKSINIPATKVNNSIMVNAYRLDRKFAVNETDDPNIGLNLDPLKRIPMKLIYNGKILLDGYAKYTSATVNDKETYYTFNLYGVLGDVFQKLIDCVFDANKLTDEQKSEPDGGAKYIIQTPWDKTIINKDFVYNSWMSDNRTNLSDSSPFKYIGMAPSNRGFYDNFNSDTIHGLFADYMNATSEYKTVSVEEFVKQCWKNMLKVSDSSLSNEDIEKRVDAIAFDLILPNGAISEKSINQYRSYEQKPYIYFDSLMKLYQNKCKELTGYEIKLDEEFFNDRNPYWTRLCYMLDFLSVRGNTLSSSTDLTPYNKATWDIGDTNVLPSKTFTYDVVDTNVLSMNNIDVKPITICFNNAKSLRSSDSNIYNASLSLQVDAPILVDITIQSGSNTIHKYYWGGNSYSNANSVNPDSSKYTASNYITVSETKLRDIVDNKVRDDIYITIPNFTIPHNSGDSISITYNVSMYRTYSRLRGPLVYKYNSYEESVYPIAGNDDFTVTFSASEVITNWRNSTTCDMKNLYTKDDSLFKVILNYTKMFGLIWNVDYNNKIINILTRKSYFNDYEIVNWTDKVDKSKNLVIEPVSFSSQYVTFNYKDTDGYRYSGYKSKYGVDYGEKKLKTKYNFDTNNLDLLNNTNLYASSVSCKSYYDLNTLCNWDTTSTLNTLTSFDLIDCENDEQQSSIAINNFYFRNANHVVDSNSPFFIADVSAREIEEDKYYWIETYSLLNGYAVQIHELPNFSPICKSSVDNRYYGCLYNCPNEDYTKEKLITAAKGNYIYDLFWSEYINERYNANNKKLTCYINLLPLEFESFNFKTFIVIDNQLFMLNKIFDYNPNSSLTKVELIQVSNINGYMNSVDFTDAIVDDTPDIPTDPETPDTPDIPTDPDEPIDPEPVCEVCKQNPCICGVGGGGTGDEDDDENDNETELANL